MNMKKSFAFLGASMTAFLALSAQSWAAGDPSKILVTIYGVAVSTTTDCSNPIVLFDSSSGVQADFLNNPILGGGNIPDGTYPCVMINMSDVVQFVPKTSDGVSCVAGQTYSIDICRSDNGCSFDVRQGTTFSTNNSGHGTNTSPSSDIVTMFLTTTAAANGSDNFRKPASTSDTTRGIPLLSPFVVSGSSAGKFVVNATNQVSSNGGLCGLDAPAFSFR
jgi:hypothetical protein